METENPPVNNTPVKPVKRPAAKKKTKTPAKQVPENIQHVPEIMQVPKPPSARVMLRNLYNQNIANLPVKDGGIGGACITILKKPDGNLSYHLDQTGMSKAEIVFILEYLKLQQFS